MIKTVALEAHLIDMLVDELEDRRRAVVSGGLVTDQDRQYELDDIDAALTALRTAE